MLFLIPFHRGSGCCLGRPAHPASPGSSARGQTGESGQHTAFNYLKTCCLQIILLLRTMYHPVNINDFQYTDCLLVTPHRDNVTKGFTSDFFHESSSPKPLKITLRAIRFFWENSRRYFQGAPGINDNTGGKFCHMYCWCCQYQWQICQRCNEISAANLPPPHSK